MDPTATPTGEAPKGCTTLNAFIEYITEICKNYNYAYVVRTLTLETIKYESLLEDIEDKLEIKINNRKELLSQTSADGLEDSNPITYMRSELSKFNKSSYLTDLNMQIDQLKSTQSTYNHIIKYIAKYKTYRSQNS